jgi:thiol-disulfide isomerase/thioredoxin
MSVKLATSSNVPRRVVTALALFTCAAVVLTACGGSGQAGPAHDFAFVAYQGLDVAEGDEVRFGELFGQGKPVVLNFWAGQCPPCRAEMPHFQTIADEYDDRVIILGVDVGVFTMLGSHDDARNLLDEMNITYPAGYAVDAAPLNDYRVTAMPTTIFFAASGKEVERRAGLVLEAELRDKIDRLLDGS